MRSATSTVAERRLDSEGERHWPGSFEGLHDRVDDHRLVEGHQTCSAEGERLGAFGLVPRATSTGVPR